MHVHIDFAGIDVAGGLTGDMFIAAGLDAFPHLEARVLSAVDSLDGPYPVACSLVPHVAGDVCGRRFEVVPFDRYFGHVPFAFPVISHGDCVSHEQTTWESVRERLNAAQIAPGIRAHAFDIFALLVEGESSVHGIQAEKVAFQEVGAWDAIAEIVGAAALIDALGAVRWTASAALRFGEEVTPLGASIVRYLCPTAAADDFLPLRALAATGMGFGSRLPCPTGHLRILCFEEDPAEPPPVDRSNAWAAERARQHTP
jgi:pyridinium-3,5-bisthiocarboxylic acid mononucleotide nickel chelatase